MHAERDYLNRIVWPELRSRSLRRGVEFVAIDLRWGVTREDAELRGAVAICLEEIERCHYVVGLVGDRYGWVPPADAVPAALPASLSDGSEALLSVTELEIRHAVAKLSPQRTLLYMRDADVTSGDRFVSAFTETDPARRERLDALKQYIAGQPGIVCRTYTATFEGIRLASALLPGTLTKTDLRILDDDVIALNELPRASTALRRAASEFGTPALAGLEAWGTQLQDDLWSAIAQEFPAVLPNATAGASDRQGHEQFLVERTALFVGREDAIARVLAHATASTESQPLLVTGEPGSGKSALLAECARRCRELGDALVLPYFIGGAPGSTSPAVMVRSLCATLQQQRGFTGDIPTEAIELFRAFPSFLARAAVRGPVVLILDALNQLDTDTGGQNLTWLPPSWPSGVKVIASTTDGDVLEQFVQRLPPDHVLRLESMTGNEQITLVSRLLGRRGKRLTQEQLARLLDPAQRPDASLPLYISVAIEELSLFGHYDALEVRIDRLPPTLTALFDQVLVRIEQDHGRSMAELVLRILAASRSGMLESEILDLLERDEPGFARLRWVRLYRSLEFYLRRVDEASGGGLLGFFHEQIRDAVFRRYFGMANRGGRPRAALKKTHRQLADYFAAVARSGDNASDWNDQHPRPLGELPFHLARAGRWPDLRQLLTQFAFLQASVTALEPQALVDHYDLALAAPKAYPQAVGNGLRLLQSALRQSSHAVARDSRQLATQLLGRLRGSKLPDVQRTLIEADAWCGSDWLRPRSASLAHCGGALQRVLIANDAGAHVAVTADGRLAVAAISRRLTVWDVATGCAERELASGYQQAFAIAPDDDRIAIAGPVGTVLILDLTSGAVLHTLKGQTGTLSAAAFTPDGRRLVTGNAVSNAAQPVDIAVLVWDLGTGALLHRLTGHRGNGIRDLAVTPDCGVVVAVGDQREGQVWSLATGTLLHELPHDYFVVTAVAILPGGRNALTASAKGTFTIWNLATGEQVEQFTCPRERTTRVTPYACAISVPGDGPRAVFAMMDDTLRTWNLSSRRFEEVLTGHADEVLDVATTADGALAVSASSDKTVRVWRPGLRAAAEAAPAHQGRITALALTPDGSHTLSASWDHTIRIWDTVTGAAVSRLTSHKESVSAVLVTGDGQRLISSSSDLTVKVWNLRSHRVEHSLVGGNTSGEWPTERLVVLMPDSKHVVNAAAAGTIAMHRVASGAVAWTQKGDWLPDYVAVAPNGRHVLFCSDLPHVLVLDAKTGAPVHKLRANGQQADIVAATPDSEHAVVGYGNGSVRVWNLKSGKIVHTFRGHAQVVCALGVTADGRFAVSGDRNGLLKVWDLAAGAEHATLEGHTSRIWTLALAPDGQRAASASGDHTLRVWDIGGGQLLATLRDEGAVWACAFTPDNRTIVAGGDSGRVHFLELVRRAGNP